ncbi:hypothetical protein MAALD49_25170 [Marinobacter shengliensis]|nr:hypothetical protein MAALD49_25170 [Marinobacter shengliensis]
MADTKAPRAGNSDAFKSGKVTYLSPLPLPTGLPPVDHYMGHTREARDGVAGSNR